LGEARRKSIEGRLIWGQVGACKSGTGQFCLA
jgi:hypothetical protein